MNEVIRRNNVIVKNPDANGKTFVFAHGFGCDQNMWARLIPYLGNHTYVLFDYVGSGQSQLSEFNIARYSDIDGYAQDIIDVCMALNINDAILIAHSVSCSAGIIAANKYKTFFSQLILIGPSPCFLNLLPDYEGGFERQDLEDLLALMEQNYIGWANYLAPVVAGGDGVIAGELSDSFCSTDPLVSGVFAKTTFFADNRDDFKTNAIPCLLLQHQYDSLAPLAVGDYLQRTTPKSHYQILDITGHCAHMSHPSLVADHIKSYLSMFNMTFD